MKTIIRTILLTSLLTFCSLEVQAALHAKHAVAYDDKFLIVRSGEEPEEKKEKEKTFADRMNAVADGFGGIAGTAAGTMGKAANKVGGGMKGAAGRVGDLVRGNVSQDPEKYLACGVTHKAGSSNNKYELCPKECPYFAQNTQDDDFCTFLCVPGDQCSKWNSEKPIPSEIKNSSVCRGPVVQFCTELTLDGKDTCSKCQHGWTVHPADGQCYFTYWKLIYSTGCFIVLLALVVLAYVIDLCCRETINPEGVQTGERYRSRAKILVPKHKLADLKMDRRQVYPADTNLCKEDVAGPGMLLHFNFQAFLIGWPLAVAVLWTILANFHNELFIIGTRKFGTPRHNCILVAWGYETQQALLWTKVVFLTLVYIGSFISFLLFGVRQYRMYEEMDAKEKTMKDFVLELGGLPRVEGAESVEKDIERALEAAGCENIKGVSVCWDFGEYEEKIMQEVRADQVEEENRRGSYPMLDSVIDTEDSTADMGTMHKKMYKLELAIFGPGEDGCQPVSTNSETTPVESWLKTLHTSQNAFVVFKTQDDRDNVLRDDAVAKKLQTQTYKLAGKEYTGNLTLSPVICEPTTVNWQNYGDTNTSYWRNIFGMIKRFCLGFFGIYIPALAVWFFAFYVPYAYSLYNFNYDNGAELPTYYGLLFTIIVVGGNATMYIVCDMVADKIGFKYKDSKQVAYMVMYLVACTLNVLLDMASTYLVVYKSMVGLGFRDYFGKKLEDYTEFTEIFETYAMQRSLAENVKLYAFPSTFLIPFLIEPWVTIYLPLKIGRLVVRTHKEIQGRLAESYYELCVFDLGRYADILLNVFLGILVFWFPGGYINILFYGMAGSHLWIYCFDHYKVLHCIPLTKIISKEVDDWAQVMMAGLCGMILSALVFKSNCEPYNMHGYCMKGYDLIFASVFAGVAHFLLHCFLLGTLVPYLGGRIEAKRQERSDQKLEMEEVDLKTFDEVAADEAYTWFSSNPVHCLRSKFVRKDSPFCKFPSPGKEHLLEKNADINCFFTDVEAEVEDFDEKDNLKNFGRAIKRNVSETGQALLEKGKNVVSKIRSKRSNADAEGSKSEP